MPEINQEAEQAVRPTLDARRTLLIGLGSTGAMICNQVLDRLAWTYQSSDNVPWLRCLVLETADVTTEARVRKQARFIHLKIDRADYSDLIDKPEEYRHKMDFPSWNIESLTQNVEAIEDGAKGVRILGRVALMFPTNFEKVSEALSEELAKLESLSQRSAADRFNEAQETPIHLNLPDNIYVYVVGTLAGGTASGTFIDIGYLLQSLPGRQRTSTGIFLLPSAATPSKHNHMLANAYAAMVELNHYSSEQTRYSVQHPTDPGHRWSAPGQGTRPYTNLYLAQVQGADDNDYPRMITACADYVYADLLGRSAMDRDARRADILTAFHRRDNEGATQKFLTFGLSSIEFPYARVAKACALHLSMIGFGNLAGGDKLTSLQIDTLLKSKAPLMDRDQMDERLLQRHPNDEPLRAILDRIIQTSVGPAMRNDDVLDTLEEQLEAAFSDSSGKPHAELPMLIVPQTVQSNVRDAGDELEGSLLSIGGSLLKADKVGGLQSLISFLEAVEIRLQAQMNGSTLSEVVSDARTQMSGTREYIHECRGSHALNWVRMRDQAVRRYVNGYADQSRQWTEQRLHLSCDPDAQSLYAHAWKRVQAVRLRLQGHTKSLQQELDGIIVGMQALFQSADSGQGASDGWHRMINGVELFEPGQTTSVNNVVKYNPGQTFSAEYEACLRETARRRSLPGNLDSWELVLAGEAVQNYIKDVIKVAFAAPTEVTRLDKPSGPPQPALAPGEEYLLSLASPARTTFISLKNRSVLHRLMNRADRDSLLQTVGKGFHLFLDWHPGSRHMDEAKKSYGFIFYKQDDPQAVTFHGMLTSAGLLQGRVAPADTADPHQILLLQERGAFSLATIGSLLDDNSKWLHSYKQADGGLLHHARGDIKGWVNWSKSHEEVRVRLRGLYLVAVALKIIIFDSATRYLLLNENPLPGNSGSISLSNDLDEAVREISLQQLEGEIKRRIAKKRAAYDETGMIDYFGQFIEKSENQFMEAGRQLSAADIRVYIVGYVSADQKLRAAWDARYPDLALKELLKPDEHGRQAYHCPECGRILGYSPDSLFRIKNGKRVCECHYCEQPIAIGAGAVHHLTAMA